MCLSHYNMKHVVYLIILLSSFESCFGYGYERKQNEIDVFEETYEGNPDNDAIIVRPCPVYDLNCIRQFFAKHSNCTIAKGPLPDTFVRSQYDIHLSRINLTASHTNIVTAGFNNTRIEEFYINRATDKLVFAIEARNLTNFTPSSYFQFFRRGREPIVAATNASILYRSLTVTAIIPYIDDLQLDKAEVTAYLPDAFPPFTIGPEVANNPDPQVAQTVAELMADIPTDVQEVLLTESLAYPPLYIQYNICDFGLKVI